LEIDMEGTLADLLRKQGTDWKKDDHGGWSITRDGRLAAAVRVQWPDDPYDSPTILLRIWAETGGCTSFETDISSVLANVMEGLTNE
jgi:hypothetical protein